MENKNLQFTTSELIAAQNALIQQLKFQIEKYLKINQENQKIIDLYHLETQNAIKQIKNRDDMITKLINEIKKATSKLEETDKIFESLKYNNKLRSN